MFKKLVLAAGVALWVVAIGRMVWVGETNPPPARHLSWQTSSGALEGDGPDRAATDPRSSRPTPPGASASTRSRRTRPGRPCRGSPGST